MAKRRNKGSGFIAGITVIAMAVAAWALTPVVNGGEEEKDEVVAPRREAERQAVASPQKTEKTNVGNGKEQRIEIPAKMHGTPERILRRYAYTLSFNRETNQPNWVAWCLDSSEAAGGRISRGEFAADPDIPAPHRVEPDDYTRSGYDRGHMAPAADMKFSAQAMRECFYMSNICPQNHSLNGGAWSRLENACRRWATEMGRVYIVCGPVFRKGKQKMIGREHRIPVPHAFFKCVYAVEKGGKPKAIGFVMTNNGSRQTLASTAVTVDSVEAITGMDFFPALPAKTEKAVEAAFSLADWQ